MLTDLEGKLENLLGQMDLMDPQYVEHAEKVREKDRRERVRVEKLKIAKEEYEERLRRSMARSAAPVKRIKTKKVMYRSRPIHKNQKKKQKGDGFEDSERAEDARNARYLT
jgi:hypothetical protein